MHHRKNGPRDAEVLAALPEAVGPGLADRPSWALSASRLCLFLLLTAGAFAVYWVAAQIRFEWARPTQRAWSRACCRLCGLKVAVIGTPVAGGPTMYAVNHVSYLDIPVLSSVVSGIFVAKAEVGNWPLFGAIARLTRTILIHRTMRDALAQSRILGERLEAGHDLILFPEGTTSNGLDLLPFKSTLFAVADRRAAGRPLVVQPVAVAYARDAGGRPLTGGREDFYAWHSDMKLVPHLVRVMGLPGAEVEVRFLEPVEVGPTITRKELAAVCENRIRAGLASVGAGLPRPRPVERPASPVPRDEVIC